MIKNRIIKYLSENVKYQKNCYEIIKYNTKTKIYNDKNSILIYYLKDYMNDKNIDNAIINIEEDIGEYGICFDNEDIIFWNNLTKCIIVYNDDFKINADILKSKESELIIFVKENHFNNIIDYYFN